MFETFETQRIKTAETDIFVRTAGSGPAVLLIHGYPQTGTCWHAVAPTLAEHFSVVVPDLRGYGASGRPATDATDADHLAYSKRAMAADLAQVMTALGHERFQVVGHDRGARVGYRLCLDHPARVTRFCTLDVVPTEHMWRTWDKTRALGAFHWTFLAQPSPLPETLIAADPDGFHKHLMQSWAAPGFQFDADAMAAYLEAMREPDAVHASCEDYRAGAGIDAEHDAADFEAGNKVVCPMLFLWGAKRGFGGPQGGAEPLNVWRDWCAAEVTGGPVNCGHFLPEEAPDVVIDALRRFLANETA
jgi:haloacetate dehalogenase